MPKEMELDNDKENNLENEIKISTPKILEPIPELEEHPRAIDQFLNRREEDDEESVERPKTRNFEIEIPKRRAIKRGQSNSSKATDKHIVNLNLNNF